MRERWRAFEARIKKEAELQNIVVTQIPSHIQQTRFGKIRLKTDCDFALSVQGKALFLDAKTFGGKRFYFSEHRTFEKEKIHQFHFLFKAQERGAKAGLLLWAYDEGVILWASAFLLKHLHTRKENGLDPKTPGIKIQPEDQVIDFQKLIWE